VARVFIEDQGWRDVPIGKPDLTRDEVYGDTPYDRCEQVRVGPNFGRLGIPVPPHYQWRQDRYKTRCELKKRECSSFHRATRIGCSGNNQHYLALVIDYYIDCADDFRGDDPSTRVPCRSTEDYIWGQKRNGDPTFCNRGAENPFDPALGYRWDVPLCLTTPECIRMGESVLLPTATADDVKVFQLECCTITNPSEVTVSICAPPPSPIQPPLTLHATLAVARWLERPYGLVHLGRPVRRVPSSRDSVGRVGRAASGSGRARVTAMQPRPRPYRT
jgi:hypothetical protein